MRAKRDCDYYFDSIPQRRKAHVVFKALSDELKAKREFSNEYGNTPIVLFDDTYVPFTLDLHGFTGKTASVAIDRYLAIVKKHNLKYARVIHGKGKVLSSIVPKYLTKHEVSTDLYDGHVDIDLVNGCDVTWPSYFNSNSKSNTLNTENANNSTRYYCECKSCKHINWLSSNVIQYNDKCEKCDSWLNDNKIDELAKELEEKACCNRLTVKLCIVYIILSTIVWIIDIHLKSIILTITVLPIISFIICTFIWKARWFILLLPPINILLVAIRLFYLFLLDAQR